MVNTAARLQGTAKAGEVLLMEETYRPVAAQVHGAPQCSVELRGKGAPLDVRVLRASSQEI